ncbi:hypothetical protein L810_7863 [Burkholderia sp. AU4i]|nr:hypothetical protein L810_7863 [Burkholderia sp. AU4i]
MGTATRFHPDQASCTIREVIKELPSLDRLVHDLAGFLINVVDLKHVFRNVDSNWRSIHLWVLRLPGNASIFHLGHINAVGP